MAKNLIQLIACLLLVSMPSDQLLDADDYLIEGIDKIVLNDYVQLFKRLEIILLPLDDVLGGHISQAEKQALLPLKLYVLPPHVHPLFADSRRLQQTILLLAASPKLLVIISGTIIIFIIVPDIMKVVLAIDDPRVTPTQLVVCQGGDLVERAQLPLDQQTLRVQVDVLAVHDLFHRLVLEFYFILRVLQRFLLFLVFYATRDALLIAASHHGVVRTHYVIHYLAV